MKLLYRLLLLIMTLTAYEAGAQGDPFRKDRKRVWRKWRKDKQAYNPYLDKKSKHKPSAVMARENRKDEKRKSKVIRKQKKRLKKKNPRP
jgi:hypothetical protein